ncbi:MAG: hypothetical protein PUE12_14485 [Oscillospiraceae bacterium]|nr:hypothetical protein [Oscillospiraceae bacterium]
MLYIVLAVAIVAGLINSRIKKESVFSGWKNDIFLHLNNITCVVFTVIFSIVKPGIYYWDEFNIWAPSAKAVKLFDRLYSIGLNPCTNDRKYPPGNAILNYFFSFFDSQFSEYVLLLSYALLFIACFSIAANAIYQITGSLSVSMGGWLLFVLSPFMAAYHSPSIRYTSLSYAYGTTMVDFNLSVVFIAAIALYIANRNKKWYLLPVLFLITIKKNGIFYALLAFCIIACFELFTFKGKGWKFRKAIINSVIAIIIPVIAYGIWFVHLDAYRPVKQKSRFDLKDRTVVNVQQTQEKTENQPEEKRRVKKIETSIKAIFIPSLRTDRYNEILDEMKWYFLNNHETVFSTDIVLIVILFVLGILAAVFRDKEKRLAVFFVSTGLTAGCFVYNLVIAYQMQFYNDMMVEYPRYMVSYYFGWMYVILLLFAITSGIREWGRQAVMLLALAITMVDIYDTGLDYTVFDAPQNPYEWGRTITQATEFANSVLKEKDRVYLVYKDQDGLTYIRYRYNLLPAYSGFDANGTNIDFSINFREKLDPDSDKQYYLIASPEKFTDVMKEYFDYIYVIEPDVEFYDSYSALFSDGMTNGTLYRVTDNDIPIQAVVK